MAGYDPMDATSIDRPVETTADALRDDLRGLRIGIVQRVRYEGARRRPRRALSRRVSRSRSASARELVEVSLPTADYGVATYYLIAPAECSSNLARFDGVRYGLRVEGDDVRDDVRSARARPASDPKSNAAS